MLLRRLTFGDLALFLLIFFALFWTRYIVYILLLYLFYTEVFSGPNKSNSEDTMADPWDVYVSFMKMNGVPLLPPVLTKERRSEMQYYQLLAKEVESRISRLTPYCVQNNGDSEQEKGTTSDSTVCDSPPAAQQQADTNSVQDLAAHIENALKCLVGERSESVPKQDSMMRLNHHQSKRSERRKDTKLVYNFSALAERDDKEEEEEEEIPEKDIAQDSSLINSKGVMAKGKKISFSPSSAKDESLSPTEKTPVSPTDKKTLEKPVTVSKKRISGSLMDLSHRSPERKTPIPTLQRQNSYTLLTPSPQLLAHLEACTHAAAAAGPDTKLSSSDSQCSPKLKRRSWDLETAKVKWSDMAMELKQKHGIPKLITKSSKTEKPMSTEKVGSDRLKPDRQTVGGDRLKPDRQTVGGDKLKPDRQSIGGDKLKNDRQSAGDRLKSDRQSQTAVRAKSNPNRTRLSSLTSRTVMRGEIKVESANASPTRRGSRPATPSPPNGKQKSPPPPADTKIPPEFMIGDKEDPSRKVRDLFETIQKQQIMQMASLVEKQKREQMMLQQVFEEQNMYLSRQIKNICPEIEIRNISIDPPTRDMGGYDPYSYSLTGMDGPKGTVSTYVYHYDGMLPPKPPGAVDYKSIKYPPFTRNIITQTRTHLKKQSSKTLKNRKRPSKAADSSDDIEFTAEPVRYPVDDHGELLIADECNILRGQCVRPGGTKRPCSANACDKHGSISFTKGPARPKDEELERERAAATVIVAYARGYLTRRLMRTARVRALVQTIRDALLCALQLHQDREGVRGADVDLHRRLIQQITAACYAVHETVITNPIAQKMAIIAADRVRQKALAAKQPAPLQRRQSPTSQSPRRPTPADLQQRASHTAASIQRRASPPAPLQRRPSPTSPAPLQRRGSPTIPLGSRQSSPLAPRRSPSVSSPPPPRRLSPTPPPHPLIQRRPSPMAAVPPARTQQKRTGVMTQSTGSGAYTIPPYSQPAPMTKSTHDAGISARMGRGQSPQSKQRWL